MSWAAAAALAGPEQLGWDVRVCDMKDCLDSEFVTTPLFKLTSFG